jgi:cytochrome P450
LQAYHSDLPSPTQGLPAAQKAGIDDVLMTSRSLGAGLVFHLGCRMAKKQEVVDDLLDALVWMRRKAKKHEPIDDLIDELVKMRRKAKKKVAKQKQISTKKKKSIR